MDATPSRKRGDESQNFKYQESGLTSGSNIRLSKQNESRSSSCLSVLDDGEKERMYARLDKLMRTEECALRHGKGMNNVSRDPREHLFGRLRGKNRCAMDAVGNRPD